MSAIETYFVDGIQKDTYHTVQDEGIELFKSLNKVFPWTKIESYFSISTPAHHLVLGENVVTCCLPLRATKEIVGDGYALSNRKFCMTSNTSYMRLYKVFTDTAPSWLPPSAKVLFIGENHQELGRPYPALASTFYDLYFSGNCAEVEAAFNLENIRGAYETYYGVTVVDGNPARVKQYTYDSQSGGADWDVVYLMHSKKIGPQASN